MKEKGKGEYILSGFCSKSSRVDMRDEVINGDKLVICPVARG